MILKGLGFAASVEDNRPFLVLQQSDARRAQPEHANQTIVGEEE